MCTLSFYMVDLYCIFNYGLVIHEVNLEQDCFPNANPMLKI